MRSRIRLSSFLLASILLSGLSAAKAQQTEPSRPRSPRLTTEDVLRPSRTTETRPVTVEANGAAEGAKASAATAGRGKKETESAPPGAATGADELAWRERLATARARAETLERNAEEAELRTTELRNQLSRQGQSANERNATAADLDRMGKQVGELRTQTREAKADLARLVEVGASKGYKEASPQTSADADGKPNASYYRQRYDKLAQAANDAQRRIQLYENRVRSLNEMITNPNRDRFSGAQLEQDRLDAQDALTAARTAYRKAQEDMAALLEEARRAGVPPGVFR